MISARYGSHALAPGARLGGGVPGVSESVDTSAVVAGFGGGHTVGRPPVRRTAMPAAFKYALAVSRRTPVVASMRRSDHPRRPSARTCCRLDSLKTLLMSGEGPLRPRRRQRLGLASAGGRFSGVHQWPVLGVHRGWAERHRIHAWFLTWAGRRNHRCGDAFGAATYGADNGGCYTHLPRLCRDGPG